jgi:hypothetical protein
MRIMFKGKEGIALILAIFFTVVLSILLMAILLLANQEINATQLQLDGNKAFYFAEAGVEYGLAQVINKKISLSSGQSADLSTDFKTSIKQNSGDSNIDKSEITLTVYSPSTSDYKFTCEVRYDKTRRKVVKEVLLYTGVWSKAMASNGDINLSVNPDPKKEGSIVIDGDIHSNGKITGDINIVDTVPASSGVYILKPYTYTQGENLPFPTTDFNYYKSIADYKYSSEDDFINALKSPDPPTSGVVFIDVDNKGFHIANLQGLSVENLTIVVNGTIHINNTSDMTIDGGSSMVALIAKNIEYNNDGNINFNNCIIYATENIDFTNMKNDVTIDNGAIYAQNGYISLNNIKNTFKVTHGDWSYASLPFLFDIYKTVLWSDTGI